MKEAKTACCMSMSPVLVSPTQMQVHMLMVMGVTIVVLMSVLMGVDIQAKSSTNRHRSNHKQRHSHAEFGPGGHALDMNKVFQNNGNG